MAIYHAHAKIFSRSNGVSILARASYRSGEKLTSDELSKTFDFTKKSGVVFTKILLPENAPKEFLDRQTLWNSVEKIETQSNAQLAREFECAVPREIPEDKREEFVTEFVLNTFVKDGMIADVAFHNPNKNEPNPHIHIMTTLRPLKSNGEWGEKFKNGYVLDENGNKLPELDENGNQKIGARGRKMWKRAKVPSTDWNSKDKLIYWRKAWEEHCNKYLAKENQISCESFSTQGIDLIPTQHEGIEGKIRAKDSEAVLDREVVLLNQKIRAYNELLISYQKEIKDIDFYPDVKINFVEVTKNPEFLQHGLSGFVNIDRNNQLSFENCSLINIPKNEPLNLEKTTFVTAEKSKQLNLSETVFVKVAKKVKKLSIDAVKFVKIAKDRVLDKIKGISDKDTSIQSKDYLYQTAVISTLEPKKYEVIINEQKFYETAAQIKADLKNDPSCNFEKWLSDSDYKEVFGKEKTIQSNVVKVKSDDISSENRELLQEYWKNVLNDMMFSMNKNGFSFESVVAIFADEVKQASKDENTVFYGIPENEITTFSKELIKQHSIQKKAEKVKVKERDFSGFDR